MQFRLGSIPVRVQWWFFIMAVLLGSNERNPAKLGLWVVVFVVSIVIHELGHALVGKAFGLIPRIDLHGMGGTTSFDYAPLPNGEARRPLGTARNVAISLAGPFAGFLFALALRSADAAGVLPAHPLAAHTLWLLYVVNIGWGIFNLMPMLPLDGGNVLRYVLIGLSKAPEKGDRIARIVSVVVAAGISLLAVQQGYWWVLYLGVLFGFRNVQALRQGRQRTRDEALAVAIEAAYRAYDRSAWSEVTSLLQPLLGADTSNELKSLAVRVCVSAMLEDGRVPEALPIIQSHRALIPTEELQRFSTRLREVGRADDADRLDAIGPAAGVLREFRA